MQRVLWMIVVAGGVVGCSSPKMPEGPPPEYEAPRPAPSAQVAPGVATPAGSSSGSPGLPPIDDD